MNAPAPAAVPVSVAARRVRPLLRIAVACGLVSTIALAQPALKPVPAPATRPTSEPSGPTRWGGRPMPRGWNNRLLRYRDIAGLASDPTVESPTTQPTDEEWQQIAEFSQDNFPNRWARYTEAQKLQPDAEVVQRIKGRIVARFRLLKRLEYEVPEVYAAAVNQGKLEDDAWGATIAARRNRNDAKLQAVMREKVAALVKDVLAERQKRIDALTTELKSRQEDLDRDKQDIDTLIESQMNKLNSEDPGMRRPDGRFGPP